MLDSNRDEAIATTNSIDKKYFVGSFQSMPEQRRHLSRAQIDKKAEDVINHFDAQALVRMIASPIYEVVAGFQSKYQIPFHFDQDLGVSIRGKKILGRFDFKTKAILVDRILAYDSPRFRWTLCHEIGHLVLHRHLDRRHITNNAPHFVDTKEELRFFTTRGWSELKWIEWQANQFASSLLLPRPIIIAAVFDVQHRLGIPPRGWIYRDNQVKNQQDYKYTFNELCHRLNVSRTMLRIRLLNLGILRDEQRTTHQLVQGSIESLFSEENFSVEPESTPNPFSDFSG